MQKGQVVVVFAMKCYSCETWVFVSDQVLQKAFFHEHRLALYVPEG